MLSHSGNGHFSSSSRTTVDFPAPDGPEITTRRLSLPPLTDSPTHLIKERHRGRSPQHSFHILNHLPHPLDRSFHLDHIAGDLGVVGLRADGVRLAKQLL